MGFAEELAAAAAKANERGTASVVGIGSRWPSGSGFVLAPGLVVTSAHNIHGESPHVHFPDGSVREATAVNTDRVGDLAVLQVSTEGLSAATFAQADPALGTPILALANPGGRGLRLSFGVVSGKDGEFRGPGGHPITGGFEHTAPLPHGSSGGPVLNFAGEVLGINTKRQGEGLYAALRADETLRLRLEALGKGEAVVRAYLGVGLLPGEVARRLRAAVGLPERNGVLVQHVDDEGPAAKAGVRKGDLLTKALHAELSRASDLHRVLATAKPGESIELELLRGMEEKTVEAILASEPERAHREMHGPGRRHHRQG
ncbi:MAG: trypsin-like peptidase domain-containing protein [Candidatus Dormiibacterota bacterium]